MQEMFMTKDQRKIQRKLRILQHAAPVISSEGKNAGAGNDGMV